MIFDRYTPNGRTQEFPPRGVMMNKTGMGSQNKMSRNTLAFASFCTGMILGAGIITMCVFL